MNSSEQPDPSTGSPQFATPILANHQRSVSTDIGELHDAVEPLAVGHDLQAITPGKPLDGMVNGLTVGSVSLVWVRYGGDGVIVDTPPVGGEFAMCAPIAPMGVEYRARARPTRDTVHGSLVLSHDEPMRMTPHPVAGCLVIATSTGRLTDHLSGFLGQDLQQPLRFQGVEGPAVTSPVIIDRTWRNMCSILDDATSDGIHPLAARSLEESILTALLLGLPHTGTASLAEPPSRSPHHLAGLIRDWLHAHYDQPIGVSDIAAAAGISIRNLQVICRDQWGLTPTQLLRGIRLDHARTALLRTQPHQRSISDIATAAGYLHMSRFAAHYRHRFGETPTQTHTNTR